MDNVRTDIVKKVLVVRHNEKCLFPGLEVATWGVGHGGGVVHHLCTNQHSTHMNKYPPIKPDDCIQIKMVCRLIEHQQSWLHE